MTPYAVSLAVVAGQGNRDAKQFDIARAEFHGTAFCLAPDVFLTAGHVYRAAAEHGEVSVCRLTPGEIQGQTVQDVDVFEGCDLALMRCPNLAAEILPVDVSSLYYLADVFTVGFPFAFEPPRYHLRAFKGYVVTRRGLDRFAARPPGYEFSFAAPPGLSGAPLLTNRSDGSAVVKGIIVDEHIARLDERTMTLGLAVDIEELLTLESVFLGQPVATALYGRDRLVRPNRNP